MYLLQYALPLLTVRDRGRCVGDALLYALEKYRTVVIVGETGCGKSTRASLAVLRAARGER